MNPKRRRNFGVLQSIHFAFFRQKVCFLSWKWPPYQSKIDNHFEALWTQKQGGILGFFRVSTFHFCAKKFVFYLENGHLINRKLIIILKLYGPQKQGGILLKVSRLKFRICIIISSFFKFKIKTSFGIVRRIQLSFFDKKTPIFLKVSRLK